MLSLVLSFAPKESTIPRRGGSPTTRAVVGASIPQAAAGVCASGRTKGLSARPLETFGHRSWRETHRAASPAPALQPARQSPSGARGMRLWAHQRAFRSPFGNLRAPKLARNHRRQPHYPRRSRRVNPHLGQVYAPVGAPKGFPLALWKPSGTETGEKPIDGSPITRAVVGASFPPAGKGYAPAGAPKGFPLALWKPSGTEAGEKPIGRQPTTRAAAGASIP